MNYTRINRMDYDLLPIHDPESAYKSEYKTAKIIFETHGDEIRVPYVKRQEKGDFKEIMDHLVEDLGHNKFRFIATGSVERFEDYLNVAEPDDAKTLEEVLNGFEKEELEEYENRDGEVESVETLIGRWNA